MTTEQLEGNICFWLLSRDLLASFDHAMGDGREKIGMDNFIHNMCT